MLGGLFDRVKKGLAKTRNAMVDKIAAVVGSGRGVDEEMLDQLETILIQADVGVETATEIIGELRRRAGQEKLQGSEVLSLLKEELSRAVFTEQGLPIAGPLPAHPYVILVVGINGVGKTTTIGKLAKQYMDAGHKVLVAACDTFRAAAIPQLEIWAERAGVELLRAQQGADPAAVAFDAGAAARARQMEVLLVDTAGRLHTRVNLMEELKKIRRSLAKQIPDAPHETLLVLDATTGQNTLRQAQEFHQAIEVTGLVLTKVDGTAKGGIVIALRRELGIPVKMIGIGEDLEDLQPFDSQAFIQALFEG